MNCLNALSEHFKRLRLLGYNFSTILPGYLIKLYDSDQDSDQSSHHIFKYNEDILLFKYPIMITKDLVKDINGFIADAEKERKSNKIKPSLVSYSYEIFINKDDMIYIKLKATGLDFQVKGVEIPLITKTSSYYKSVVEILGRVSNLNNGTRIFAEYVVNPAIFDVLVQSEDVQYISLELDDKNIEVPLAISMYYGIRKPLPVEISLSTTNNQYIYMLNWRMSTECYDENHVSFLINR